MSQNNESILSLNNQALHYDDIASITSISVEDVKSVIAQRLGSLDEVYGVRLATSIKLELTRIDSLISVMYQDLNTVDDEYCEFKGNLIRDKYIMRQKIVDNIRKLTESKIKLLQLNKEFAPTEESDSPGDTRDTSEMSLEEKLAKYRDLLQ